MSNIKDANVEILHITNCDETDCAHDDVMYYIYYIACDAQEGHVSILEFNTRYERSHWLSDIANQPWRDEWRDWWLCDGESPW